jgi:hypothetical protein
MEKVIVARGRTVVTPHRTYKPGDEIELPTDEVERLIPLGTVHRPGEPVMVACVPLETLRKRGTFEVKYTNNPAM